MRYGVNAYAHVSHTHTFINKPNPVAQLSATGVCEKETPMSGLAACHTIMKDPLSPIQC